MIYLLILVLLGAVLADPLCEIENGFDIQDQDLKNMPGSVDTCFDHCRVTHGCLAWSWNDYNGGTCWLKSNADNIIAKADTKMGRMVTSLNGGALYKDVDFIGNDIDNKLASNPKYCINICKSTFNCRAFTWNSYNNGTCWLKSSRDKVAYKEGVYAADAYPNSWPHYQSILLYKSVGRMELQGTSFDTFMGQSCLQMCQSMPDGFCIGVSEINMHHTTCTLYSSIISVVGTANPYITSWMLVTPEQ